MGTRLSEYYDGLERLCALLRSSGEARWATSLEDALRGGSTSGEILANTANVLQRILNTAPEADLVALGDEVAALLSEAEALMNGAD